MEIVRISCLVSYQILEFKSPAKVEGDSYPVTPERKGVETR